MFERRFLYRVLFGSLLLLAAADVCAQTDVRQKLMKDNGAALKAIKAAAVTRDYATIETKTKEIMQNGDKVLALFRSGRGAEKTKAKPEIWEKWDDFSKNPGNVKKAARELADAAKARDDGSIRVKVKNLSDACAACHTTFRAEKYSQ